jgi:hypothetical protein
MSRIIGNLLGATFRGSSTSPRCRRFGARGASREPQRVSHPVRKKWPIPNNSVAQSHAGAMSENRNFNSLGGDRQLPE